MAISIEQFNLLSTTEAKSHLLTCCTSDNWAQQLTFMRPFISNEALLEYSDSIWQKMTEVDYLQAFAGHPQIGDVSTLQHKYKHTANSAADEQSDANDADMQTLQALADANQAYLEKFGFIFIVFATGKSALQMLELLKVRLLNTREQELINAAHEQNKITRLRLTKLLS